MVNFIFPEIPEWRATKEAIKSETIGKILKINVDWRFLSYDIRNQIKSWKTDVKQGGGVISFYFSHVFYYLENFIGRIKSMKCTVSSPEKNQNNTILRNTILNMTILFENGCIGNAHMDIGYSGQQKHVIEFNGEKGVITLKNFSNNFVDNFGLSIKTSRGIQKINPKNILDLQDEAEDSRVKIIKPIAERFVYWCKTGISAKPDFQDGMRVQELIEMARNSNSRLH